MVSIVIFVLLSIFLWLMYLRPSNTSQHCQGFEDFEASRKDPPLYKLLETAGSVLSVKQNRYFNTMVLNIGLVVVVIYLSKV